MQYHVLFPALTGVSFAGIAWSIQPGWPAQVPASILAKLGTRRFASELITCGARARPR